MIRWLIRRFLVAVFTSVILVSGQSIKMANVCLTLERKSNVTYTCESHQMIHVISILYQEASEACDVIDDACHVQEDDQTNGFTTNCNGKTQCTDDLSTFRINRTCDNITKSLATVLYECVNDQPIDVCSTTATSSGVDNILHLKSPNYPAASSGIDTCDCDITGTDISVQILEMLFTFDVGMQDNIPVLVAKANLTLTGDTASWTSYPSILIYHTEVIDRNSHLSVKFEANGTTGHLLWIRLNGTSTLNIKCNDGLSTTESLRTVSPNGITSVTKSSTEGIPSTSSAKFACNVSSLSTHLSSSGAPILLRNTDDNLNSTIIGALSGVIAMLLLVVAALIIYFKCVKPRRLSATTLAAEDIEPHYEVGSDNQGVVSQPSENETQNIPDSSHSDYSDMRHYSNMDNVYTGLEPQGDDSEELPNNDDSYSHLQTNVNDDTTHGYSGLK